MRLGHRRLGILQPFLISLVLVQFLMVGATMIHGAAAPTGTFTFTASGDFAANSNTNVVLTGIPSVGASFTIALGDFSYNQVTPESAWCQYVTSRVGSNYPFELISGNHESNGENGLIDNFAKCLPDRIGGVVGTYAKEYYFDYPSASPLARFLLISPGLTFTYGGTYDYSVGSARYNWVASVIDDARARGISWVIVGMHEDCITTGQQTCEIGPDIFNLLVSKRVDLILQGHDHNYQRSKQLTCAQANQYVSSCVANDGSTGTYSKGAGSILVIDGTSGAGNIAINPSNPDFSYFAETDSSTYGFVSYTVSPTSLSAKFVPRVGAFRDSFNIVQPSPPLSTSFSYSPSSPTVGTTITFQASANGGTPPYTFSWSFGDGTSSTGSIATHSYSSAGSYTALLTTNDSDGHTATSSKTVHVSPPAPSPLTTSFTYSPSSPQTGTPITFQASANGGTPAYNYSWTFGDGATGTGSTTTHAYTTSGSYTVVLTVKDSSSPQQTATSQQTVTINSPPPPLTASFTYSPSTLQTSQQVTFTGSANGGTTPYTFSWTFGDGSSGTGSTATHTYASSGTFTVVLTVSDSGSPQQTVTSQQSVTVTSSPLSASFTVSPSSPDAGQTVSFSGSASGGSSPYNYSWNFGDGGTRSGGLVNHTFQSSGSYTVVLTVVDYSGQTATLSQTVTVSSPLSASFVYSPSNPAILTSISFTGSGSGGTQPYSYSWDFGDGSTSTGVSVSHSYVLPGTYTVTLAVTDSNGRTARASRTITVTLF